MRRAFAAAVLLTVSGCTRTYNFDLRGTVKDAVTGKTVRGVTVELVDVDANSVDTYDGDPSRSDTSGSFRISFGVEPVVAAESGRWKVKLSCPGYDDELIQLGPVDEPESGRPVPIVLRVFLRPSER